MRFGVTLPNIGVGDDPLTVVELACEAEEAGWDGVFVWDWPGGTATFDDERLLTIHEAWTLLALMAVRTERVLLGTMITPIAWRQPWMVARQAITLDRLSKGRFVLSVGLGAPPESGPTPFGEEADRRERARMLDEGLEVVAGLWSGEPFSFAGRYFTANDAIFLPRPIDRIPVWVVGAWPEHPEAWPKRKSMRRALKWNGVLPHVSGIEGLRQMTEWIRTERRGPFDVVYEGGTQTEDVNTDAGTVREWRDAGATWWLEAVWWSMYSHPGDPEPMRKRIRKGPPKL